MNEIKNLLDGFVDTHIHAGPGLMPREFDAWDLVRHAAAHRFKAVVIKDHHVPSVGMARILQDHHPEGGVQVFGSLVLNNMVGGLNPQAVETAVHFGVKIIWLPTVSAWHHHNRHEAAGFPKPKQMPKVKDTPIKCLDADNRLTSPLEDILSIIAENRSVVLATGHLSPLEVNAVVHRAKELGIERIVVTHPLFLVNAGTDEMQTWVKLGAYLEFTAINSFPESKVYAVPPGKIAGVIRSIGADRIVISSDAGLGNNGWPFENVARVLELIKAEGIEEGDLRKLVVDNPSRVMGI